MSAGESRHIAHPSQVRTVTNRARNRSATAAGPRKFLAFRDAPGGDVGDESRIRIAQARSRLVLGTVMMRLPIGSVPPPGSTKRIRPSPTNVLARVGFDDPGEQAGLEPGKPRGRLL